MMMKSVNIGKHFPKPNQLVMSMDQEIEGLVKNSCFDIKFVHLLRLRASQINQCAFCVRFHSNDALKLGESTERVNLVSAWRETDYYSQQERSALALTEAITLIHDQDKLHLAHDDASKVLSDEDISLVEWVAIVTNSLNRIAISSSYEVAPSE
jgi:AhpD family alkylhydroperoxidase